MKNKKQDEQITNVTWRDMEFFIKYTDDLSSKVNAHWHKAIEIHVALVLAVFAFLGAGYFSADDYFVISQIKVLLILEFLAVIFTMLFHIQTSIDLGDRLGLIREKVSENYENIMKPDTYKYGGHIKFWSKKIRPIILLSAGLLITAFVVIYSLNFLEISR